MSEVRDPPIKIFGADIRFPETHSSDDFDHLHPPLSFQPPDRCVEPNASHGEKGMSVIPTQVENANRVGNVEEGQCVVADTGSQEKVLKRPDKVIPCPRCKSLNTKFCYFNNYNVNQPRHFCKNCQRYWTAGGTIRNVPVGAGKRKNKQLSLQYIQDTGSNDISQGDSLSPSMQPIQPSLSLSLPSITLDGNDETAKLCVTPLCESMVSMFRQNSVELGSIKAAEESSSSISSISPTTLNELELPYQEASAQIKPSVFYYGSTTSSISLPYCTTPQWTYPWISVASLTQPGDPIQTGAITVKDAPMICTSSMTYPVTPYWGCMPVFNSSCSTSSSPNLRKHLLETNVTAEQKTKNCVWAPKSKKIDSMDTAAKCSLLNSIGSKPCKNVHISKGGVFKAFCSIPESSKHAIKETDSSLKLNPAALSRSQSFQESS